MQAYVSLTEPMKTCFVILAFPLKLVSIFCFLSLYRDLSADRLTLEQTMSIGNTQSLKSNLQTKPLHLPFQTTCTQTPKSSQKKKKKKVTFHKAQFPRNQYDKTRAAHKVAADTDRDVLISPTGLKDL